MNDIMNDIKKITTNTDISFTIGKTIFHSKKITSTNKIILDNVDGIFSNGDVFFTDIQTKGVGRYNREWDSQKGGLYFSILFQKITDLQKFYKFIILIALAIKKQLEELSNDFTNFKIKWPNDIYYKDKKICGILSQTKIQGNEISLVIGVGININNQFSNKDNFRNPPISLKEILNKKSDVYLILQTLIKKFNYYYDEFLDDNFNNYLPDLNKSIYKKNEQINFTKSNKTISIKPLEFSQNGHLICEINGKRKLFSFGELE